MLRRPHFLFSLVFTFLATSGFTLQTDQTGILPTGWAALGWLLVITLIVAILLIFQRRKTPEISAHTHEEPVHGEEPPLPADQPGSVIEIESAAEPENVGDQEPAAEENVSAEPQADSAANTAEPDDLKKYE
jgi:hypothetical protein